MFTNFFILIVSMIYNFNITKSQIVPKVVGGGPANISYFPHSAFILIIKYTGGFVCGSSILNQKILLTAAHCIDGPYRESYVYTGHTDKTLGDKYIIAAMKPHEHYNEHTVSNDIGLILVKTPIRFSSLVQRVALVRYPPIRNRAAVAGWGLVSEEPEMGTQLLHYAELKVWTFEECRRFISSLPRGCLCAGSLDGKTYASSGDSGSALIVNDYIQIGLVSYKRPTLRNIVAFSNVSYFYSWIKHNAKRLYCKNEYN
ncbi:chymotrypsin-1-like [Maniola jurtina]|uniref:chymotrypsin-1-like n=1 Tax=Maniola jurtina TaxID=191418 RepID=UPI001E689502|nr:chymotrypsin-1-like [Maniola jurtina]